MASTSAELLRMTYGSTTKCLLLQLPEHILRLVLSHLSYHEVSEARRVCQCFNRCCQDVLTQGFNKVDKFHNQIQKEVKSKLPRRESERRNHVLSRHVDILSAVETRLSLLSMTYSKYIDHGLCCFIPGKVLDELFLLLEKLLVKKIQPPRAHEFLQELRDISSMAMEHFEEKIMPVLKQQIPGGSLPLAITDPYSPEQCSVSSALHHFSLPSMSRIPSLRQELQRLQHQVRVQSGSLLAYKKELVEHKNKIREQDKVNTEQDKKLQEQDRKLQEQKRLIADQNIRIDRLENALNDINNRFSAYSCLQLPVLKVSKISSETGSSLEPGPSSSSDSKTRSKRSNHKTNPEMTVIKSCTKRKLPAEATESNPQRGRARSVKRKKY